MKVFGKVTDSSGAPLPGVTVVVKGTTTGIITDMDGNYSLANVPSDATLVFSFVGMKSQEIAVSGRTTIDVVIQEETVGIEEVVAIGYGVQKKVNLTGAVEQISSEQLSTKAVVNIGQALQGVIPNLNVTITNGNPLTTASYNIRGGTSFSGSDFISGSPLTLIDGVPRGINDINPEDIESISVIKDASAAAIYGARAAYGVILVTTKKGEKGANPKISYSGSYTMELPLNDPGLLNSVEYQQAYMDAKTLNGEVPTSDDEYKLQMIKNYYNDPENEPCYYMTGNTINWVANNNPWKLLIREMVPMQKHVMNVSGGSARNSYYASLGVRDQNGIIDSNEDYKKTYNANLGFSTDINNWLSVDTKFLYDQYITNTPNSNEATSFNDIFSVIALQGKQGILRPI
jgi:TonB-linked SusC/RagA family outer membrane protein